MMKKLLAPALALMMILTLMACGKESETVVYVQNVGDILGAGSLGMSHKYPGMVVSENQVEITRDASRAIGALYVEVGQEVTANQTLFEYDVEKLSLELAKQKLEKDRLNNMVSTLKSQIAALKKEQQKVAEEDQLSYTVEIQDREVQLDEAEHNVKLKQKEIDQTQSILNASKVSTPVAGRVVAVNENNFDSGSAFIVIQQSGSYRIKASANELNLEGLIPGTAMVISARTTGGSTWRGTIANVDMESGTQGDGSNGYYDPMTSSSSYSFYVDLESTEGLILGQHVYLELETAVEAAAGLWLPEYFLSFDEEGTGYVWAETEKNTLEKRTLELGTYRAEDGTYRILSGLSLTDYIAFPSAYCEDGIPTTHSPEQESLPDSGQSPDVGPDSGNIPDYGGETSDGPMDPWQETDPVSGDTQPEGDSQTPDNGNSGGSDASTSNNGSTGSGNPPAGTASGGDLAGSDTGTASGANLGG